MINPKILNFEESEEVIETDLSFFELEFKVQRSKTIEVAYKSL